MFVKKFEAESIEQGLKNIRQELGPDALILGTQRRKNGLLGKGIVEITAAYQAKEEKKEPKKTSGVDTDLLMKVFPYRQGEKVNRGVAPRYVEIDSASSTSHSAHSSTPKKNRHESEFVRAGLSAHAAKELALKLVCDYPESLNDPSSLEMQKVKLLGNSLKCMKLGDLVEKKAVAFLGTAGSGKTTSLVKLALFLKQQARGVCLTSLDSRKIVSGVELAQYGRMLRVPIRKLEESKNMGVQLVDTPSLRLDFQDGNLNMLKQLETIQASIVLCLEATSRLPEMLRIIEMVQSFSPIEAIWVTKMDLATQCGFLYDLIKQTKVPICAITQSQSFQDQINFPEPMSLGRAIIKRGEMT